MGRGKKFIKSAAVYSIGTIIPKIGYLILLPLYTGFLSKTDYGNLDLYQTVISLFVPIATLEIQQATFRFLLGCKQYKEKAVVVSNTLFFSIPFVLLISALVFLPFVKLNLLLKVLFFFSFNISSNLETLRMITRGLGKNRNYSASAIISSVVQITGAFFCLFVFHFGLYSILVVSIVAGLISMGYLCACLHVFNYIDIQVASINEIKKLIQYSLPIIPTAIASWTMALSDRLVLSYFIGSEANAIYSVANKFPQICNMAVAVLNLAWQESASLSVNDKDSSKYYSDFFSVLFRFLTGSVSLLIAASPALFKMFVIGDYQQAIPHMYILFVAVFFSCISTFYTGIYIAYFKTKTESISVVAAALINLGFDLVMVHHIGIYAASLSTMISYIFLIGFRFINIQKICRITYEYKVVVVGLLSVVGLAVLESLRFLPLQIFCAVAAIVLFVLFNKGLLDRIKDVLYKKRD